MVVLTGVNFADEQNMYKTTKNSLLKFIRYLTVRKARTEQDIELEPSWRKSTSSSKRNVCAGVQRCKIGWMKRY